MMTSKKFNSNERGHVFYPVVSNNNFQQPPFIIDTNTLRSYRYERKPPNYTDEQLIQLEESYIVNPYLSKRALINLARKLCINEDNVRLWYRKRRLRDNSESNNDDIDSICSDSCGACRATELLKCLTVIR